MPSYEEGHYYSQKSNPLPFLFCTNNILEGSCTVQDFVKCSIVPRNNDMCWFHLKKLLFQSLPIFHTDFTVNRYKETVSRYLEIYKHKSMTIV